MSAVPHDPGVRPQSRVSPAAFPAGDLGAGTDRRSSRTSAIHLEPSCRARRQIDGAADAPPGCGSAPGRRSDAGCLHIRVPLCRKPCRRQRAASWTGHGPRANGSGCRIVPGSDAAGAAHYVQGRPGCERRAGRSSPAPHAGRGTECTGRPAASTIGTGGTRDLRTTTGRPSGPPGQRTRVNGTERLSVRCSTTARGSGSDRACRRVDRRSPTSFTRAAALQGQR